LRQLSQAAAQQPEVNSDKVASIRAALADGSYKVQPGVIAARLVAFEAALRR
jgi:flagellar biosynthesis anti-sigma factor FlgM